MKAESPALQKKLLRGFMGRDPLPVDVLRELNIERITRVSTLQALIAIGFTVSITLAVSYAVQAGAPAEAWLLSVPILIAACVSLYIWIGSIDRGRPLNMKPSSVTRVSTAITFCGVLWGSSLTALAILIDSSSLVLLIIAVGLSSTAMTVTSYLPLASLAFAFFCITPLTVTLIFLMPNLWHIFCGLYLVYFAASIQAVFVSYEGVVRDIETRVQNASLFEDAKAANESKAKFIASMTHELRTPLNAISGYAQLVKLDTDRDQHKSLQQQMDNILDASSHLLRLIDDVMEISRYEAASLTIESVYLAPEDIFDELLPIASEGCNRKGISYRVSHQSDEYVFADQLRLKQVLLNLISNAIKYTPEGGSIEMGSTKSGEHLLRIYVSDTGLGIPADEQEQIFEQFYRSKKVENIYPGTGLGLHHSKRLIEAMGGSIGFESVEAIGSTFYVDLPAYEQPNMGPVSSRVS